MKLKTIFIFSHILKTTPPRNFPASLLCEQIHRIGAKLKKGFATKTPALTRLSSTLVVALLTITSASNAASVAPVAAQHGMVVTAQHLATKIGVDVLKKGGNAIDAAVAVGYALSVVYPAAGNLGGGGFMTIQLADGRKTFIDFREKAPLAATANMYIGPNGKPIPKLSTRGHLAVAVPGTVHGLEYVLSKYGTMKRENLIAPAIQLAAQGFVLNQGDIGLLNLATADFRKDPAAAAIFLPHGQPLQTGDRLVQKDLAKTLEKISQAGIPGFYQGEVATAIIASNQAGKGILTQQDFDQYSTRELKPVECDYRNYHVISAPPPSSGGTTLCEILNILEGYPLKAWGFRSAKAVYSQIEAMRYAYKDRNAKLGDPAFINNPVSQLISKSYAAKIRAEINSAAQANRNTTPIDDSQPTHEGTHTTHYSIIDNVGNAVSVTYTLNDWFGARVVAAGTGILLNDEMDDFTTELNLPNLYGLVQGQANAIAPGKRPLSSMTPTIVTQNNHPLMVLGTPGGSTIITVVLHTILNVIDYGMDIQEAVDAPRFHQQWQPEATNLERFALSPDTQAILERMGLTFSGPPMADHVTAILVGSPALGAPPIAHNRYYGANDPRHRTGLALGY